MAFYPQLRGALAQYPLSRRRVHRTARNVHADGSAIKLADPGWTRTEWQLTYTGLSDEERNALEQLFAEVEGRLGAFTFPDPWANLLAWSEDIGNGIWTKGTSLDLGFHANDPFGGTSAIAVGNRGSARQAISQSIPIPAAYRCCFSVYARAVDECEVVVFRRAGAETAEIRTSIGPAWRRLQHSTVLQGSEALSEFGLQLDAGCETTVFGFQLEAQAKAGPYRKTTTDAGIYTDAHFDHDILESDAEAAGRHVMTVRVRARSEGAARWHRSSS